MEPRLGKQEKARGLERGSSYNDDFCADSVVLHGLAIDEGHAAGLAGLRINGDFAYHRIRTQRQISRIHCGLNQAGGGVKGSMNVATALPFAGAATGTAAASFVWRGT